MDVTGTSKGKGFSGVIKRWGAHRLKMTHGTGPVHRQVGSMGSNTDPSRVFKGKHMAGQLGNERVTVQNLDVVKVDSENNLIALKGAVPGPGRHHNNRRQRKKVLKEGECEMPKAAVYNMAGEQVDEIELLDSVFGIEPNKFVLHAAVVNYMANQRQGTQSTLTRAEVSGGGRKPWKQKGTGHARQGSIRSPQWRHGGIALGPKPRDYSYSLNKKVKRLAIKSALSSKVLDGGIKVIDVIKLDEFKTRIITQMLDAVGCGKKCSDCYRVC